MREKKKHMSLRGYIACDLSEVCTHLMFSVRHHFQCDELLFVLFRMDPNNNTHERHVQIVAAHKHALSTHRCFLGFELFVETTVALLWRVVHVVGLGILAAVAPHDVFVCMLYMYVCVCVCCWSCASKRITTRCVNVIMRLSETCMIWLLSLHGQTRTDSRC